MHQTPSSEARSASLPTMRDGISFHAKNAQRINRQQDQDAQRGLGSVGGVAALQTGTSQRMAHARLIQVKLALNASSRLVCKPVICIGSRNRGALYFYEL